MIGNSANISIAIEMIANTWTLEGSLEASRTDAKIAALSDTGARNLHMS